MVSNEEILADIPYIFYLNYFTMFGEWTKPMFTLYDSRRQIGMSGIWTCDHTSPQLYHYAMVAGSGYKLVRIFSRRNGVYVF